MTSETVQKMSLSARGLFIDLLALAWKEGSIPDDIRVLARLEGISLAKMQKLWPELQEKWEPSPGGRLINKRLESERTKAIMRSEAMRLASRTRWYPPAEAMPKHSLSIPIDSNAQAMLKQSYPQPQPHEEGGKVKEGVAPLRSAVGGYAPRPKTKAASRVKARGRALQNAPADPEKVCELMVPCLEALPTPLGSEDGASEGQRVVRDYWLEAEEQG